MPGLACVFTYRFGNLGIGRGADFASLNSGEPDFSRFSVMGDRIRWSDVLPDIDLEVRYIHDILKVDVIVKQSRREAIQSRHAQGWLTARFDIPSVLVRSQAKQAGHYARPGVHSGESFNLPLLTDPFARGYTFENSSSIVSHARRQTQAARSRRQSPYQTH